MDNNFSYVLSARNIVTEQFDNAKFDVTINLFNSLVVMVFVHNPALYASEEVLLKIAPAISDKYNIKYEELIGSFVIVSDGVFLISFNYSLIEENQMLLTKAAKSILLKNKVMPNEIKSITYTSQKHENGKGLLKVRIDIGYDEDEDSAIDKHRKFLEKKLTNALFLKSVVDLT